jgi:hypothetical protein
VAREKDEIETVLNFIDTIFYGDTGHRLVTPSGGTCPEFCPVGTLWRMKFQAFCLGLAATVCYSTIPRASRWQGILSALRDCAGGAPIVGEAAMLS